MWPAPCILYVNAAAPLLVVAVTGGRDVCRTEEPLESTDVIRRITNIDQGTTKLIEMPLQ